jgi:hypothetical protein
MKYYVKIGVVYIKNVTVNGGGHGELKFALRKHTTFGFDTTADARILVEKLSSVGFVDTIISYE